jgi:hypothetical protein
MYAIGFSFDTHAQIEMLLVLIWGTVKIARDPRGALPLCVRIDTEKPVSSKKRILVSGIEDKRFINALLG